MGKKDSLGNLNIYKDQIKEAINDIENCGMRVQGINIVRDSKDKPIAMVHVVLK